MKLNKMNLKSGFLFLFLLTIPAIISAQSEREISLALRNSSFSEKNTNFGIINLNKRTSPFSNRENTLSNITPHESNSGPSDLTVFSQLGNNILNSFKGDNLYLHLAGIASTVLIVETNTDYKVNKFFHEHQEFGDIASPITRIGFYLPFVVGGSLYAYGKIRSDDQALGASFAVFQASLISLGYNSLLKAITGRPHPDPGRVEDMEGLSKTFRFGFLRGGVFWGWPSGHTATTMTVVSALTNYYPNSTWLKVAGYSLVAYMIYGVSSVHGGRMHWFSDAIAAAFMSYAIGSTVGKFYRNKFNKSGSPSPSPSVPLGLNISLQF